MTTFHGTRSGCSTYFNPHEREARDLNRLAAPFGYIYFNPHEREARDFVPSCPLSAIRGILIHTSVKLVTYCVNCYTTVT